jgi:DNA-binding MarR family transcriptional regulator
MRDEKSDGIAVQLDNFLPFQLAVVANKVSQTIAKIFEEEFALHIPEWRILATLLYHSPVSSQVLVQRTAMDPARVSRAQTRLADLGLIDVQQDPDDKRRVLITLTQRGRKIISETLPRAIEAEQEIFGSLSNSERASLEGALDKLFKVLSD